MTIVWLLLGFILGGSAVVGVIVFDDYWQWAGSHGPFSKWADRQRARSQSVTRGLRYLLMVLAVWVAIFAIYAGIVWFVAVMPALDVAAKFMLGK